MIPHVRDENLILNTTANRQLPTANCQLPTANCQLSNANLQPFKAPEYTYEAGEKIPISGFP